MKNTIKKIKAEIKNLEALAQRYPEDENLQYACKKRIEEYTAELALLK